MYERFLAFGVFSNRMACFKPLSYSFAIFSMCLSVCFVLFAIFSSVSSSSSNCTISLMERTPLRRSSPTAMSSLMTIGQLVVMKAITRSPIVIKELIAVGDDLRKGVRSIKEIVQFDDEELTEEKIANKTKQTLKHIEKIAKLYDNGLKQAIRLEKTPKAKKRSYIHAKWDVARTRVEISLAVRDIDFNPFEKKRLIDKMRGTVERLQSLEREAGRLERRVDVAKGDVAAEARKELRTRRTELKDIEE